MAVKTQKIWRALAPDFAKTMIVLALFLASLSASSFSAYALDQEQFQPTSFSIIFCGDAPEGEHNGATCGVCALGFEAAALPTASPSGVLLDHLNVHTLPLNADPFTLSARQMAYRGRAPPVSV